MLIALALTGAVAAATSEAFRRSRLAADKIIVPTAANLWVPSTTLLVDPSPIRT
jgi:hypothetical protein